MGSGTANQQRLLLAVVATAVATPFLIIGAIRTMDGIHTSALHWLDEAEPARIEYEIFTQQFEGGNFVLISWPGCTLDDPRLAKLESTLDHYSKATAPKPPLVERAFSGSSVLEDLLRPDLQLTRPQAIARLQGSLIGPDGESTCVVAVLSERGGQQRAEGFAYLVATSEKVTGVAREELRIAGPSVDAYAVDIESDRSVDYYAAPSAFISFLVCWWCLRSLRFSVAILAVAGFGELLMLGSLHYFGVTMDAVLIVLPPLVFVLTVSSGIHLVNYYYDQVRAGAGPDAPRLAVRHGWAPCGMAALTTALGLGSLLVSRIVPVATFGQFAAGGVVVAVLLLFFSLPGVMSRWPAAPEDVASGSATSTLVVYLVRMAQVVCRHATLITAGGMVCLIVGGVGLAQLRTSIGVGNLFPQSHRVVQDFRWMEEHVAHLVPLEVVIRFPSDDGLRMIDRLTLLNEIEASVRGVASVGGVMSALTFCPEVPTTRGSNSVVRRAQFNARLEANRGQLVESHYLHESDDGGQDWRISARVSGIQDLDYQLVLNELRERVDPLLDEYATRHDFRPSASYTGTMPLVYGAQHALLQDMFYSMLLAFVLVWLVMSLMLTDGSARGAARVASLPKGLWLGALAMLPNLFPIVVVFGVMGWLDWPADIGSTMTACVALGIAVDDTLHFLAWYRRETAKGDSPQLAIRHSFQHCGRAMIQTTVICGFGMLVFGLSGFLPTRRFSLLMFTLLNSALLADLVFLPAILASPLGSVFAIRTKPGSDSPEAAVL
ncbi:MMPL family protein [Posidoniimonas polymericola]|uniref:MMPL family protein n=1 Tax=Posidoniimonas polymericola TaxID=2528002 RepID=A0A5C5YPW9_9BACT|nr:MMPL family transporter [Posidoniimonas polymericola]TWT76956.1 MMPL family protein [Posidoniimonas polymericola]